MLGLKWQCPPFEFVPHWSGSDSSQKHVQSLDEKSLRSLVAKCYSPLSIHNPSTSIGTDWVSLVSHNATDICIHIQI